MNAQMSLPSSPSAPAADRRFILLGVSWATYERLLADFSNSHAAHCTYDQGVLEIMVVPLRHEKLKHILETLVEFLRPSLISTLRAWVQPHSAGQTLYAALIPTPVSTLPKPTISGAGKTVILPLTRHPSS